MKRSILLFVVATIFLSTLIAISAAFKLVSGEAGELDPTFGSTGRVITSMPANSTDEAHDVAIQSDNKVIVVGSRVISGESPQDSLIIRYNADGSLDTTFDADGILTVAVSADGDEARAVAVQPNGKILVAGHTYNGPITRADFYVMRLNSNGSPDVNFGTTNGTAFVDFNALNDLAFAMKLQPDGKILLGGRAGVGGVSDFGVARLNSDGLPDGGFGVGGKVTTNAFGGEDEVFDLGLYPDGRIVAAGRAAGDFFTVRYNADGSPDTTFDGDGKVVTGLGADDVGRAVEVYSDGKIAVSGIAGAGTQDDFGVVRYNTDGSLDTTFDSDGKLFLPLGTQNDNAYDSELLPDGKLVVIGGSITNGFFKFAVVRINIDGSLDSTFGVGGVVRTAFGTFNDIGSAGRLLPDGRLVVAGLTNGGATALDFAVARFLGDGSLDPTFGFPGRVTTAFYNTHDSAEDVLVQPDGKIVAVGSGRQGIFDDFVIARYLPDGGLDPSFGNGGKAAASLHSQNDGAYAVALQSDGKIVVSGYAGNFPNADLALIRYLPNGQPDPDFGIFGTVVMPIGMAADTAHDVVVQPDGKIVTAGLAIVNSSSDFAVVRLNPNGSPDPSFGGGDGIVTTPVSPGTDVAWALGLQADGKIVVAGDASPAGPNRDFAVVRYNTDGTLDGNFGVGGIRTTPVGGGSDSAAAMAIQCDGKIILAGSTTADFALVRYTSSGSLDTSFDGDGIVITGIAPDTIEESKGVVVQPDSKIVVAGITVFPGSQFNVALVRYNPEGSLDTTWDEDGILVKDYGSYGETASGLARQADGKFVTAGGINIGSRREFMVLRFRGGESVTATAPFDFDGDGKTDLGIFRPGVAEWWINRSSNGTTFAAQFGATTDRIAPGDYTGDGKADIAIWRPSSGEWFILRSEDSSFFSFPFGTGGDGPMPADYDNDGKVDAAVFRESTATWYIRRSSDGGTTIETFGANGDVPVVADYDGDGRSDIAIYRPSLGQWWINRSTAGVIAFTFGSSSDKPVQGDYTGDGKSDVAFWRPSTGEWYVLRSEDFSYYSQPFGTATDIPSPGDYDGDGKFDPTVFRPSSATWFSNRSTAVTLIQQFGSPGDQPVPNAFIP